jgi:WD40 repeat protein
MKQVISGSDDRTVRYWDQMTAKQLRVDSCPNQINNMDISTSEAMLVTSHMKDIKVWSTKQGGVI